MNRRKFISQSALGAVGMFAGNKLLAYTPTDPAGLGPSVYETYTAAARKMSEASVFQQRMDVLYGWGNLTYRDAFCLMTVDLPMPDQSRNELNERHEQNMDVLAELKERLLLNAG